MIYNASVIVAKFSDNPIQKYPLNATAVFFGSVINNLGILVLDGTNITFIDTPFCSTEVTSSRELTGNPTFMVALRRTPLKYISDSAFYCGDKLMILDAQESKLEMLSTPPSGIKDPKIVSINVRKTAVQSLPASFMYRNPVLKFLSFDVIQNCCRIGAGNVAQMNLLQTKSELPGVDIMSELYQNALTAFLFSQITTLLSKAPGVVATMTSCNYKVLDHYLGNTSTLDYFYNSPNPGGLRTCSCNVLNCNSSSSSCVNSINNHVTGDKIDGTETCRCLPGFWGDGFVCYERRQSEEDDPDYLVFVLNVAILLMTYGICFFGCIVMFNCFIRASLGDIICDLYLAKPCYDDRENGLITEREKVEYAELMPRKLSFAPSSIGRTLSQISSNYASVNYDYMNDSSDTKPGESLAPSDDPEVSDGYCDFPKDLAPRHGVENSSNLSDKFLVGPPTTIYEESETVKITSSTVDKNGLFRELPVAVLHTEASRLTTPTNSGGNRAGGTCGKRRSGAGRGSVAVLYSRGSFVVKRATYVNTTSAEEDNDEYEEHNRTGIYV